MSIRFKRLMAFAIDWTITLFPFIVIFSFLTAFLRQQSEINTLIALLLFLIVIFAFVAFILRDVIFKGRSLGKRIFGLYIYEKSSLKQASVKQCFFRNIFFFLYIIDGIILLATGQTIGDRAAGTLVTSKQGMESYNKDIQADSTMYNPPVSNKRKIKRAIEVFTLIVGCLIIFMGLIQIALNTRKNTDEYKIAYSYFIESHAFEELNVEEAKIRFNQYSWHTYTTEKEHSAIQTVEIGFMVNFKSFEVVCHKENDKWQVCKECTLFE
ncbi:MAG: RDD family protein [Clostridia bacterium]|nr:RDD family protein [Clostridia bacterium]